MTFSLALWLPIQLTGYNFISHIVYILWLYSIVDVTFISDIAIMLWACGMQTQFVCIFTHALMVRGWYFISICSSSASYVMYNVYNQTVTKLFIQSGQLYAGNCQCYGEF